MTSQVGLQTIARHILSNISESRGNQTMKFGQLIKYNKRNIFYQQLCGKWCKKTTSRPPFIFWKHMKWKQVVCNLVTIYFDSPQLAIQ